VSDRVPFSILDLSPIVESARLRSFEPTAKVRDELAVAPVA